MAHASIPVDLLNPGQVFACLGFLEAAEVLLGGAEGGFDWRDGGGAAQFLMRARHDVDPIAHALDFLRAASVSAVAPHGAVLTAERWGIRTVMNATCDPFPCEPPASPATLPAILDGPGIDGKPRRIALDYWADRSIRDNVKFWAGAGGYPGAALARDALELVRAHAYTANDIFDVPAPQSSSFRFDWRRDYIAIDTGFAVNDHRDITMIGYPLVEIMAAIGVSHARPQRIDKLHYRYGVITSGASDLLLPPSLLRAALGCAPLPFPRRTFSMRLDWPGQEGQARCVTDVTEEPRV